MAEVSRQVEVPPTKVWSVLADGWSYPLWVVGATHMRDVDAGWPAVGTRIHHSVGVWPLMLEDDTEVVGMESGRWLELRARAWPTGAARVQIALTAADGGTLVRMNEFVESGPGRFVPGVLEGAMLRLRNTESLARLATIAENRSREAAAQR
ncbi:MAG TPA: SRPBCC family protein [Pseudonocardia sp.]|nr:SRPBCC family protein [Pseudonocardia sp.]